MGIARSRVHTHHRSGQLAHGIFLVVLLQTVGPQNEIDGMSHQPLDRPGRPMHVIVDKNGVRIVFGDVKLREDSVACILKV